MAFNSIRTIIIRSKYHQRCFYFPSMQHHRNFSLQPAISTVSIFFTDSSLTQACQWSLENFHIFTGLPWLATVLGTTLVFKIITSPLMYGGEKALARYELMKTLVLKRLPEIRREVDGMAKVYNVPDEKKALWVTLGMRKMEKYMTKEMNCHPFTIMCWPILQAPVWIGMSFAIRNISGANPFYLDYNDADVDAMASEHVAWFSDLTSPDPLFILPAINCVLYLFAPTVSAVGTPVAMRKTGMYYFGRGLNIVVTGVITYVATHLPAIVTFYWMVSMSTTLILRLILKTPRVRRSLAIDRTPFESKTPVRELILRVVGAWNGSSKASPHS